jgi:hypothetical protein
VQPRGDSKSARQQAIDQESSLHLFNPAGPPAIQESSVTPCFGGNIDDSQHSPGKAKAGPESCVSSLSRVKNE